MLRRVAISCLAALLATVSFGVDELAVANAALRDGLWDVARRHASVVTGDVSKAVILASYANEGKWPELAVALSRWEGMRGPLFDYYNAVLHGDAVETVRILRATGDPKALIDADMLEADILVGRGKRGDAEKLWRGVVAKSNANERVFALASANLGDVALLREAHRRVRERDLKLFTGLRLGVALLRDPKSEVEGAKIIRAIVRDSPDADGGREAFLAIAAADVAAGRWKAAEQAYHDAVETWPDVARTYDVFSGRGWALLNLGRLDEAMRAFLQAEAVAKDDESRAAALLKQGDVKSESGDGNGALDVYREVTRKYPATSSAARLKSIIAVRECELRGREWFRQYRFAEADKAFSEVAAKDPSRRARMAYFRVLCLFGLGQDGAAERAAMELAADSEDPGVRADATLWLAKYLYNRGEWKTSRQSFVEFADLRRDSPNAPAALLWAARAAVADGDFAGAIQIVSRLSERYANAVEVPTALLVQGEALIELARFDEAVLVLERVPRSESAADEVKVRAQILIADALFAMGADNSARYSAALEAYRALRLDSVQSQSVRLLIAYKIGRTLEKLKRVEEAIDQYYAKVVIAYRAGRESGVRFDDEARAAFSRAALYLVNEYESRGKEFQARGLLELLGASDVPAAAEARRRLERLEAKGRFL